jgi:hypothetical protein
VEYTWVHHAEINLAYLVKTKGVLTRKSYLFGGNFGLTGHAQKRRVEVADCPLDRKRIQETHALGTECSVRSTTDLCVDSLRQMS